MGGSGSGRLTGVQCRCFQLFHPITGQAPFLGAGRLLLWLKDEHVFVAAGRQGSSLVCERGHRGSLSEILPLGAQNNVQPQFLVILFHLYICPVSL
jgi:hypothetical protein